VHIDASNFALGVTLGQNPNNTIDRPIYCANKLMNSAKKIYTTTEKEALAMIYVVRKFKHYLLGNNFFLCKSSSFTRSSKQTDNNKLNCYMDFTIT
jgi:hypothetical protein